MESQVKNVREENVQNVQDNAQKTVEDNIKSSQNVFLEHIKKVIKNERLKSEEPFFNYLIDKEIITEKQMEMLGIFSFVMGIDYTDQLYRQKKILNNVISRFKELVIYDEELSFYKSNMEILASLKPKELDKILGNVMDIVKSRINDKISDKIPDKTLYKNMKININRMLDNLIIPIKYSESVLNLRKEDLTYENLMKINMLINEQGYFPGNKIKALIKLYGESNFRAFLYQSAEAINNIKYFTLYEESIRNVVASMKRFPLTFSPDEITDEEEQAGKEESTNIQKESIQKEQVQNQPDVETIDMSQITEIKIVDIDDEKNKYVRKRFDENQLKDIMINRPDQFVAYSIEDAFGNYLKTVDDVYNGIEKLIENTEYMQSMYTFMAQSINSSKRVGGQTYLDIDTHAIVDFLDSRIKISSDKYKELAEFNCAKIPDNLHQRIIDYINDTISSCIIKTQDQKQYLVSQIISNGINTWNQLQQIISVIETCDILGSDVSVYVNLVEYLRNNSEIYEVFENAEELTKIEIKLSVYRSFREWYKWHINEEERLIKKSEKK